MQQKVQFFPQCANYLLESVRLLITKFNSTETFLQNFGRPVLAVFFNWYGIVGEKRLQAQYSFISVKKMYVPWSVLCGTQDIHRVSFHCCFSSISIFHDVRLQLLPIIPYIASVVNPEWQDNHKENAKFHGESWIRIHRQGLEADVQPPQPTEIPASFVYNL